MRGMLHENLIHKDLMKKLFLKITILRNSECFDVSFDVSPREVGREPDGFIRPSGVSVDSCGERWLRGMIRVYTVHGQMASRCWKWVFWKTFAPLSSLHRLGAGYRLPSKSNYLSPLQVTRDFNRIFPYIYFSFISTHFKLRLNKYNIFRIFQ